MITIDVRRSPRELDMRPALDAAAAALHKADAIFSTYRDDSWINRLRRAEVRLVDAPRHVAEVLEACAQAEQLTGGWFTACWRGDGSLDPTGLVKGWAASRASQVLLDHGLVDHCVNAAGDIALAGRPEPGRPWRVGIAHPRRYELLGAIDGTWLDRLLDSGKGRAAVATSGPAERGRQVRNPRTGRAADGVLSATVVGADLAAADACATALVAAGADSEYLLADLSRREWVGCLLTNEGRVIDPTGILGP